jgi:hypothetical protein
MVDHEGEAQMLVEDAVIWETDWKYRMYFQGNLMNIGLQFHTICWLEVNSPFQVGFSWQGGLSSLGASDLRERNRGRSYHVVYNLISVVAYCHSGIFY